MYDDYRERMAERDAKYKVKQQRLKDRNFDSWHGIRDGSDSEDDGVDKGYRDQMVRVPRRGDNEEDEDYVSDEGGWDIVAAQKAKLGEEEDSDDSSDDEAAEAKPKRKAKVTIPDNARPLAPKQPKRLLTTLTPDTSRANMSRQAQVWFDQGVFKDVGDLAALDEEDEDEDDEAMDADSEEGDEEDEDEDVEMESDDESLESTLDDVDEDEFEIVPQDVDDEPEWDVDDEDQDAVLQEQIKKKGLLTAEAQTLASKLVNREITASQLMDQGFNRLSSYHKDGLPAWFLDDEAKHYRPNIPITKEAITALRDRQRALDARPIKKVAEAKMRKKRVAHTKLERAKKKAAGVMETEDLNDGEKARAVSRLLRRAANTKRPEKKVVVARGSNKGIKGRPKGVKGKYKIVDARMRKETRALKRIAKSSKTRR
jgi:AdoMet-dependent rRNA methyltransferase SPB1